MAKGFIRNSGSCRKRSREFPNPSYNLSFRQETILRKEVKLTKKFRQFYYLFFRSDQIKSGMLLHFGRIVVIDHPVDAEPIGKHSEIGTPEGI